MTVQTIDSTAATEGNHEASVAPTIAKLLISNPILISSFIAPVHLLLSPFETPNQRDYKKKPCLLVATLH